MEAAQILFSSEPLTVLSFVVCVAAVLWCALSLLKLRIGKDRLAVGLVGMLSLHQCFSLLGKGGLWLGATPVTVGPWITLGATGLYLATVATLQRNARESRHDKLRLRLAEGNQAPPPRPASLQRKAPPAAEGEMSQAMMESSPLAMFAVDSNGSICFWNDAAEKQFGWRKSEVIGRSAPFEGTETLRRKDGSEVRATVWNSEVDLRGQPRRLTIVASS
ncbi:MAG: PAS domain S-box protein [Bryobacteraceae bacterium]